MNKPVSQYTKLGMIRQKNELYIQWMFFLLHAAYAIHLKRLTTMTTHLRIHRQNNACLLNRRRMLPKPFTFLFLLLLSFCAFSQEKSITGNDRQTHLAPAYQMLQLALRVQPHEC